MEQIEYKKNLEKIKAIHSIIFILLLLVLPTFLQILSGKTEYFFLILITFLIGFIYFRIRKLEYKIKSM